MPQSPLVSTQWLADNLASPDVVVVNAWLPPLGQPDVPPEYEDGHIPGAVFFDVDALSDTSSTLPHMLPPAHVFSSMMRRLGIGDGRRVGRGTGRKEGRGVGANTGLAVGSPGSGVGSEEGSGVGSGVGSDVSHSPSLFAMPEMPQSRP